MRAKSSFIDPAPAICKSNPVSVCQRSLHLNPSLAEGNDATGHVFVDIVSHWMDANHEEATLNMVAGKVAVVIQKGMIRPVSSFVAAKFAAECHNEVKNHVTVRSHWKKYKGDSRLLSDYYHSLLPQSFD